MAFRLLLILWVKVLLIDVDTAVLWTEQVLSSAGSLEVCLHVFHKDFQCLFSCAAFIVVTPYIMFGVAFLQAMLRIVLNRDSLFTVAFNS